MATPRSTVAETELRSQEIAELIAVGGTRFDCCRYAATKWGVCDRTADRYLARARKIIQDCWSTLEKRQLRAELLSQYASLQRQARQEAQLAVALGCLHGAAKVAKLVS